MTVFGRDVEAFEDETKDADRAEKRKKIASNAFHN